MYTIHIQPKKQFKVQIIGILEEIDSLLMTKNALTKRCQKFWAGTSPAWLFNEINPDTFRQNSTCTFPAVSTTQQSLLQALQ